MKATSGEYNSAQSMAETNGVDNAVSKSDNNVLYITDKRTGFDYTIPITRNSVSALHFKAIKAPEDKDLVNSGGNMGGGMRILDPGFQNTAVKESNITFV